MLPFNLPHSVFVLRQLTQSDLGKCDLAKRVAEANTLLQPDIRLDIAEYDSLIVWLTRSDKRNAINFVMMDKLIALAAKIASWTEVRAVIIAGEGKSFSTGIDLADLNNRKNIKTVVWELAKPWQSKFQKVCLVWRSLPIPVISVLHGHCLGAGLQLALASDIRITTPDCQFAIMEAKWGLVADMGLTQSSLGQLRPDVAKELAMTARLFDGQAALGYGVVTHVHDTPLTQAKQLVAELATRSPDAVTAAKRIINVTYAQTASALYHEKLWQIKLLMGQNRKLAVKKAKDDAVTFLRRQFG